MPPQTRMTKQRAVILEELRKVCTHPTADELYTLVRMRMPHISLGTVYRNLDFLAETGEILKLEVAGSTRRFDGTAKPHAHIRCTCCGAVGDVPDNVPEPDCKHVSVPGFTVQAVRVEFEGICDKCAGKHV